MSEDLKILGCAIRKFCPLRKSVILYNFTAPFEVWYAMPMICLYDVMTTTVLCFQHDRICSQWAVFLHLYMTPLV